MHPLIHLEYHHAVAAERRRRAGARPPRAVRSKSPPVRAGLAHAVARLAVRLDAETARRAV